MQGSELISVKNVKKSYKTTEGQELLVLDSINFNLKAGEFVALLGKSGSGKSTLLRIIAGLSSPSAGSVCYKDVEMSSPIPGIAMVFQNFALLPWLTVLENVELGLEAQGVKRKERRQRALKAIDTIGLDGFESAYPKELSGGMRQRVGFARALVVEPEILLMDEPFSALDILTAENLRNDLLDLWSKHNTHIKSILCVTHDIEEAILMADRIIIFASDPGRIHAELVIDLPYPRNSQSEEFRKLLDEIYSHLTTTERGRLSKRYHAKLDSIKHPEYAYRLPDVSVSELTGLLENMEVHEKDNKVDLPALAESLHLDVNNIFPLTEVLDMLRFIKIIDGTLSFTEAGKAFEKADILHRKQLFAKHLLAYIPLAAHIRETLDEKMNHRASEEYFLEELTEFLSDDEAERVLRVMIDWGRYAEIFAYDYDAGILSLENPQ
ncbi:MAG: tauB [Francisellaceae bacterium]|nr:tauB [Francisellaceae bacterium]